MYYKECRNYLTHLSKKGSDFSLSFVKEILNRFSNPQNKLNIIHVAGTNGKGSTITYLSSILQNAGYKVGTFTSPAVFNYNEMFKINDKPISDKDFEDTFNQIYPAILELKDKFNITSFEVETVLQYVYFYNQKVDFLIVECGLGGKYDATNVEDKNLLSILVSIDLDHTNILGNLSEITHNKCGIIRDKVITTSFNNRVLDIIKSYSNNVTTTCESTSYIKDNIQYITYKDKTYETSLLGLYQKINLPISIEAAYYLKDIGYNITDKNIFDGIKKATIPGRFEIISLNPTFIIDGAHNPNASIYLESFLKTQKDLTLIVGMFKDKNYLEVISKTVKYAKKVYTFDWNNPRHLDGEILKEEILKYNKNVEYTTLSNAIKKAMNDVNTTIVAFGSLSFLKEIKQEVQNGR